MRQVDIRTRRTGFTLIEVLVTVVVIGVLAAVVIPAVTSQVGAGDSTRVFADLNSIRTGIENFAITVRAFPGDLDDLANPIATGDLDLSGTPYLDGQIAAWKGPYIEQPVASSTGSHIFNAFQTGYGAFIDNKLALCNPCSPPLPVYILITLRNLSQTQALAINDLIDGFGETNASTIGRFRFGPGDGADGFYYATPFK